MKIFFIIELLDFTDKRSLNYNMYHAFNKILHYKRKLEKKIDFSEIDPIDLDFFVNRFIRSRFESI